MELDSPSPPPLFINDFSLLVDVIVPFSLAPKCFGLVFSFYTFFEPFVLPPCYAAFCSLTTDYDDKVIIPLSLSCWGIQEPETRGV